MAVAASECFLPSFESGHGVVTKQATSSRDGRSSAFSAGQRSTSGITLKNGDHAELMTETLAGDIPKRIRFQLCGANKRRLLLPEIDCQKLPENRR